MAETHSWHPGSGCLNARWAIPVALLRDELLSSWLVRAALAQGCDPLVLTGDVWPGWRVWATDPDRGISTEHLEALAVVSGIPAEAFDAASIRPTLVTLFSRPEAERAVLPWMLAAGVRNRLRHGGLQYCPACLAEERHPFFRLPWRLAWHTACDRHGLVLLDRCPKCAAPVEPHRLTAMDCHLAVCARCRADLRQAGTVDADTAALAFQNTADLALASGTGLFGGEHIAAGAWFNLARHLVGLLRFSAMGKQDALAMMLRTLGVDTAVMLPTATGLALELLPTVERAILLGPVGQILTAGADRLIAAAEEAGVSQQGLKGDRRYLPAALEAVAAKLPSRSRTRLIPSHKDSMKPRSRQAVMRIWARLERKWQGEMP